MKVKIVSLTVIIAGTLVTGMSVQAQNSAPAHSVISQGAPSGDLPLADYQAFDRFAIAHPEIISDLSHHRQLIEDQSYLARHQQLRDFLVSHAELRGALIEDPGNFIEPHADRRSR